MRALGGRIEKASQFIQEVIATIIEIKEMCKQMSVIMQFQYTKGHPGKIKEFHQDPSVFLINMCHNEANKARIKYKKSKYSSPVELNGVYLICYKRTPFDRTVAEGVREINAKVAELDYIASQYKEK